MSPKKTIPVLLLNSSVRGTIFEQDCFKKRILSPKLHFRRDEMGSEQRAAVD